MKEPGLMEKARVHLVVLALAFLIGLHSTAPGNAEVLSDFSASAEDWTVIDLPDTFDQGPYFNIVGGPVDAIWSSTAGAPAGAAYHLDTPDNSFYFQAPAKFLGDLGWSWGNLLSYDLLSATGATGFWYSEADVILTAANGVVLVAHTAPHPGRTWQRFFVSMVETGWYRGRYGGPQPTTTEFLDALSQVKSIWIRGEYYNGFDGIYLDNVRLRGTNELRRAQATATVMDGVVVSVAVKDAGYGYKTAPGIRIHGSAAVLAAAKATLVGAALGAIELISGGSGYSGEVAVVIDPPWGRPSLWIEPGAVPTIGGRIRTGLHYRLEDSENLTDWRKVEEFTAEGSEFTRLFEPSTQTRYFRLLELD